MLCRMVCCAMLATVLRCTVVHCTVLYCTVPHCTVVHCTVLHCTVVHCTVLYCTVPHCTVLHCTLLYCTTLYCSALHCIVLHCTVLLHCIVPNPSTVFTFLHRRADFSVGSPHPCRSGENCEEACRQELAGDDFRRQRSAQKPHRTNASHHHPDTHGIWKSKEEQRGGR